MTHEDILWNAMTYLIIAILTLVLAFLIVGFLVGPGVLLNLYNGCI